MNLSWIQRKDAVAFVLGVLLRLLFIYSRVFSTSPLLVCPLCACGHNERVLSRSDGLFSSVSHGTYRSMTSLRFGWCKC